MNKDYGIKEEGKLANILSREMIDENNIPYSNRPNPRIIIKDVGDPRVEGGSFIGQKTGKKYPFVVYGLRVVESDAIRKHHIELILLNAMYHMCFLNRPNEDYVWVERRSPHLKPLYKFEYSFPVEQYQHLKVTDVDLHIIDLYCLSAVMRGCWVPKDDIHSKETFNFNKYTGEEE